MDQPLTLDAPHLRISRCRHGFMLYNLQDVYIGRSFDVYGEFSQGEVRLFSQILQPGMVALDVGANIGAHTVWMSRAVGPGGRVIAFEPQRSIFQMLCANLAINGLTNVDAHWSAVGSAPGEIMVPRFDYTQAGNYGGVELGRWPQGDRVPVMTIDALDLPACHMIKIDVEGMEQEVLGGAGATIERHRPVLYVENDRQDKSHGLIEAILKLGYRAWWHLPPLFNPNNYRNARENIFGGVISINLICLHNSVPATMQGFREVTGPDDTWREPAPAAPTDQSEAGIA